MDGMDSYLGDGLPGTVHHGDALSLYQTTKFLHETKLKAFADDKIKVAKIRISLLDKSRKYCGERRKCWLPAFSSFPTVFSKAFFVSVVKSRN